MGMFARSKIETVSILGCGWLGMALAKDLIEKGYKVKGSTTHPEKTAEMKKAGIIPFEIRLLPEPEGDHLHEFLDSDLLIIAIPPGTKSGMADSYHPTQIKYLIDDIKKSTVNKIIYISSTSVYPTNNQETFETAPLNPQDATNKSVLLAEEVLLKNKIFQTTVLRCGGLMGYDRVPGKYFAGEKNLKTAKVPVNYIHRDDVVLIIEEIIKQGKWGEIYNVVAPKHPTRKEVYTANARIFGFEIPTFDESESMPFKTINSSKLMMDLNYRFKYPNPLEFDYSKILPKKQKPEDPHEAPDLY
jgi:nucleoside-diphosphate-sugar epimerase